MLASDLDTLLELLRPTETVRQSGAVDRAWEPAGEVWAEVEPLGGRERVRAEQTEATITCRVRLRAHPDLGPKWRLRDPYTQTIYHVQALTSKRRDRFMECLCTEVD